MSRIYVLNENDKFDYSPAMVYGELVFLSYAPFRPNGSPDRNKEIINRAKEKLADFNPAEDFLVLTGAPIYISIIAGHVLNTFPRVSFLQWDNREHKYFSFIYEKGYYES